MMDEFERDWLNVIVERLDEIVEILDKDSSLRTPFAIGAYALLLDELHRLDLIDDRIYLYYLSVIFPSYYKELITNDEAAQKMYLRCQYEAWKFGADRFVLPQAISASGVSYHRG